MTGVQTCALPICSSRDQAILGQPETTRDTSEAYQAPAAKPSETVIVTPVESMQAPIPGSLEEQIQREVDAAEAAPIPESRLKDSDF